MLPHLIYMECFICKNFFFVYEEANLPDGVGEPKFCPYCGTEFDYELEVDEV